jgi:putative lipoic acid-binding regulatory protein
MTEEELIKFRQKLEETLSFPSVYMFKFIVSSELRKIALVENLFEPGTDIHRQESGRGRYTSITAKQVVMSIDEIIEIYRLASKIEGIIYL